MAPMPPTPDVSPDDGQTDASLPKLPSGWISQWDRVSRKYYYVQISTGVAQWELPTSVAPGRLQRTQRSHNVERNVPNSRNLPPHYYYTNSDYITPPTTSGANNTSPVASTPTLSNINFGFPGPRVSLTPPTEPALKFQTDENVQKSSPQVESLSYASPGTSPEFLKHSLPNTPRMPPEYPTPYYGSSPYYEPYMQYMQRLGVYNPGPYNPSDPYYHYPGNTPGRNTSNAQSFRSPNTGRGRGSSNSNHPIQSGQMPWSNPVNRQYSPKPDPNYGQGRGGYTPAYPINPGEMPLDSNKPGLAKQRSPLPYLGGWGTNYIPENSSWAKVASLSNIPKKSSQIVIKSPDGGVVNFNAATSATVPTSAASVDVSKPGDSLQIRAESVDGKTGSDPDVEIRKNPIKEMKKLGNMAVHERPLQKWEPAPDVNPSLSLESPTQSAGWDQFAINERLFGVRSDYDENMYTTTIDRSHPQYAERAAHAEKKAREIEGSSTPNVHVREERAQNAAGEDRKVDKEDLYSGVSRPLASGQPNKYTPPARRIQSGQVPAQPAHVDPAIISSQVSLPGSTAVKAVDRVEKLTTAEAEAERKRLEKEKKMLEEKEFVRMAAEIEAAETASEMNYEEENSLEAERRRLRREQFERWAVEMIKKEKPTEPSPAYKKNKDHISFAESSRDNDSSTFQGSSNPATESTAQTSVSGKRPSQYFQKAHIIQSPIIEEEESIENGSRADLISDGQSTISADSVVVLTFQQKIDVIEKFSRALLKDLPIKCFASDSENLEMSTFHQSFSKSVKDYSKKVMANSERRSRQRQASKAVRLLRNEIIHECYQVIGGFKRSKRRDIPSIVRKLGEDDDSGKMAMEKVKEWNARLTSLIGDVPNSLTPPTLSAEGNKKDIDIPSATELYPEDKTPSDICNFSETIEQGFSNTSQLSKGEDENISAEDQDLYTYLTEHPAFSELVNELKALVERHFCNQKELIHHRILLAVRRPNIIEQSPDGKLHASFFIDWDVLDFLQTCYSTSQDLRYVIAITGTPVNAQLATVETYLQQTWPSHTWDLVDALNTAIAAAACGDAYEPTQLFPQQICVSLKERTVSVSGTEDLLIIVGQQLAWLGAACQYSAGQLAHCYTSFTDIESADPMMSELKFEIKYEVTPLDSGELTSCWSDLVGDSVIVVGFPFAPRNSGAIGLEVPLQIMGAIADIPLMTLYRGGYVLKGQSMVFVPVKRGGDFVQWHLHNQPSKRISYQDVKSMFPERLLVKDLNERDLLRTRSFLGWCPESLNSLASGMYEYGTISYTKTPYLSKKVLSLTGASIGFQQLGAGNLNFAISRRSRMHHIEKPQYYKDLLDAAKQIPVILQDMEDRRAWYADGERIILHIILHRHALNPFKANGPVHLVSASPEDPASVRDAMMANADILLSLDRDMEKAGIRPKLFKEMVNEIYTVLEGLMAESNDIADAGITLSLDWKKHIQGWEYMDVVNRKLAPRLRETELKSTCGQWPELARDRNAVVLFGKHLQNIMSPHPHPSARLCKLFSELPKHKDYLAIESEKLEGMYVESGAEDDRAQITLTGLQLHRSQHLFEPCPRATLKSGHCKCDRVQQLVPSKAKGKVKPIAKMNATGAVIIGQGNTSWINELSHSWFAFRGTSQHQPIESHSQVPDLDQSPQGTRSGSACLRQPSISSSLSGPKSSWGSQSFSTASATPRITSTTSDMSFSRPSRCDKMSTSNSTEFSAKTLVETGSVPLGKSNCLPMAHFTSMMSRNLSTNLPDKQEMPPKPQSTSRQWKQTPLYSTVAQHSKYSLENIPVVTPNSMRTHLSHQPISKRLPEKFAMDMSNMPPSRLRRKPKFPLEHRQAPPTS